MIRNIFKYWAKSRKTRFQKRERTFAQIVRDCTVPFLYNVMIPASGHIVFAATATCKTCGAGLGYRFSDEKEWDCIAVLLGKASASDKLADGSWAHPTYPFAFYEIMSENQPSAYGRTTRPPEIKMTRSYLLWSALNDWANKRERL